jgi:hypothetical protein
MITHCIPSLRLALDSVEINDKGMLKKAHVVNGDWILVRSRKTWQAKSIGSGAVVNDWPAAEEDDRVLLVPTKFGDDYNKAIAWACRQP